MEEKVLNGLLFDFYGDLLSDKKREIYRAYAYDDLSLSEMADEFAMSRQGISETIHRTTKSLHEYEERLGLVSRYQKIRELAEEITKETDTDICHQKAAEILDIL